MEIGHILLLGSVSILCGLLPKGRNWLIFIISILVIFWLQPALPIRNLGFWLPAGTLGLTLFTWIITRSRNEPFKQENLLSISLILIITLLIGLNRYVEPLCCILPTRPPVWYQVLAGIAIWILVSVVLWYTFRSSRFAAAGLVVLLVGIFIILKSSTLMLAVSIGLRNLTDQQVLNASPVDIRWIGFSYIAFRLIHVLRDRLAGRLESVSLKDLIIFTIFYPAFNAGPIDRIQRFLVDVNKPYRMDSEAFWQGGRRVIIGLLKKFALADSLALIALNDLNALQTNQAFWLWLFTYAYAFRIYLDFSGYTDIAIGLGNWMGFNLPENFQRPYFSINLTQFWNTWHITLAQWFRVYFFNPLTRWLRSSSLHLRTWVIILAGQLSTMVLIGLWHGMNWNFLIWGAWHGIGLFIHNRWSAFLKPVFNQSSERIYQQAGLKFAGGLFTFHYVTLSWVWFALSTPDLSWHVIRQLLGVG